jgi:dihydrodipicolinate synthase/N-acetylneuraminate lyase
MRGETTKACAAFASLQRLTCALTPLSGGPNKCKTALRVLGLPGGDHLRAPFLQPNAAIEGHVATELKNLEILAVESEALQECVGNKR